MTASGTWPGATAATLPLVVERLRDRAGAAPTTIEEPDVDEVVEPDLPWIVIVWNDPINLMSYVTWVFQKLFGFPREKAEQLMWDVHTKGKAVVANGPRERCEAYVGALHGYGLWATLQRDR